MFLQSPPRSLKKRPESVLKFPSSNNEQFISSDINSEQSSLKENEGKAKIRKIRGKIPNRNTFKLSTSHQSEEKEHKTFQPITTTKKYKLPAGPEDSIYTYSSLNFGGAGGEDSYDNGRPNIDNSFKQSSPIIATSSYNFEQSFGGASFDESSTKNYFKTSPQSYTKSSLKLPEKLIKSPEDDFRSSPFYDFSIKPQQHHPRTPSSTIKYDKFKTDLGVKSLAIRATKNKFETQVIQGGFQPIVKDFTNIRGNSDVGSGIASPGQIRTYYEREGVRNSNQGVQSSVNGQQFQQFHKTKDENKRLEKLVEQQFKLQQQKQIAKEKEAELKAQHQVLQRQKEKLLKVEKQLNDKVTKETSRHKRRPQPQHHHRRHRNPGPPSPVNPLSLINSGKKVIPLRTVNNGDGSYRVSFNVNH